MKTYVGTDGKLHFVNSAGADTALNFNKGLYENKIHLGYISTKAYTSFDLSSYPSYNKFTVEDNFMVDNITLVRSTSMGSSNNINLDIQYDSSTGIVKSRVSWRCENANLAYVAKFDLYLLY